MSKAPSALLLVVAGFLVLACGPPHPGGSCSKAGYECLDTLNALECRDNVWVQLPCRGSGGCTQSSDTVTCDSSGNLPGDNCASVEEGHGMCSATGTAVLECRSGVLVQTNTCRTCVVSNGLVTCQP